MIDDEVSRPPAEPVVKPYDSDLLIEITYCNCRASYEQS